MEEENEQSKDEMRAYEILLKRHLNDDRLLAERSTIFLASSAILFLGLASLPQNAWFVLRFIIPFLGLIWSVLAIISNRRTSLGLDLWNEKEKEIEDKGQIFSYMREKKMLPHRIYEAVEKRRFTHPKNRHIFTYFLPSLFIILWISSLIWLWVN